jgi:hypothetical protein
MGHIGSVERAFNKRQVARATARVAPTLTGRHHVPSQGRGDPGGRPGNYVGTKVESEGGGLLFR